MATYIDHAATAHRRGHVFGRGALHLSDVAAERCLAHGQHDASEIEILINAGIYRDHNVVEPALASIIQEDLGANLGHPPRLGHHGTFSFDLVNGGCGVLSALQLVDGFVGPGTAKLGLVVAGDADPSPRTSHGFPFSPAGGALLLRHVDGDLGFGAFELRTFPADAALFESTLRWQPPAGFLRRGHNVVEVTAAASFGARCIEHAIDVATAVLAKAGLHGADVDLLIASQYPAGFADAVARGLGLPEGCAPHVRPELARAHTAGPIAALEAAIDDGRFARARHTLFVTAGAGITIGAALYRQAVE